MGIRGVWRLFKDTFKNVQPVQLNSLKIGIDIFNLAYTYKLSLDSLVHLLISWSSSGHKRVCIWDGVAPKEKQDIVGQRRSIRDSATEQKKDLELYLEEYKCQLNERDIKHIKTAITSLNWQGWHMTNKLKKDIQERLGPNVEHIFAKEEADDILIEMVFDKRIDVVVTLDSDIFVMGAPRIWRILRVKGEWIVEDVLVEDVCNNWGISLGILQDAAFLSGWDRCHTQGGIFMSFQSALTRTKHYGGWKTVLEKTGELDKKYMDVQERLVNLKKKSRERWLSIIK
jgi:hypothetical protein